MSDPDLRRTDRVNAGVPADRYTPLPFRTRTLGLPLTSSTPNPDLQQPPTTSGRSRSVARSSKSKKSHSSVASVQRRKLKAELELEETIAEAEGKAAERRLQLQLEELDLSRQRSRLEMEELEARLLRLKSVEEKKLALTFAKIDEESEWESLSDDLASQHSKQGKLEQPGSDVKKWLESQDGRSQSRSVSPPQKRKSGKNGPRSQSPSPVRSISNFEKTMSAFTQALTSVLEKPRPGPEVKSDESDLGRFVARQSTARELPKFDGSVEDWPSFKSQFERSTALCKFSDDENLFRLQRSLTGKAKDAVQSMLLVPGNVPSIIKVLEKNFGEPEFIIESLLEKVKKAESLKEGNLEGIREFSNLVRNLRDTLVVLKMEGHQRNPQLMKDLAAKLSPQLQHDWVKLRLQTKEENRLDAFSDWLSDTADAYNHLSKPSVKPKDEKKATEKSEKKPERKSKLNDKTKEESEEIPWHLGTTAEESSKKVSCLFCQKQNHAISDCFKFKKLDVDKRWDFVTTEKYCFSCLKPGHGIKSCNEKKKCGVDGCPFPHSPILHKAKVTENSKSPSGESAPKIDKSEEPTHSNPHIIQNKILSKVVPVILTGPAGQIKTHAFLDEGSEVTLIEDEIADRLGLVKVPKPLAMRWSDGTLRKVIDSSSVQLQISGLDQRRLFDLNGARTMKSLDLGLHSTNLKELTTRWPHLKKAHLTPLMNAKPSVFIGSDHAFLIAFDKAIKGPENAPILGRTPLGWILTGNASELYSGDPFKTFCSFMSSDEDLHQAMKDYFRVESLGVKIFSTKLSQEEMRVKKLMDLNTRRVQGGWETGLLWKSDCIQMPTSYNNALKRLQNLEKKMDGDPHFSKQYQDRMQYNFDQGYARLLTPDEVKMNSPKSWFLPHFGVCNFQKPGKVRLVFDAAAKSHGTSLNDQLMTGPDLLTSLAGTLLKFRQKEIGFSGDIRDMFHRVKIREEDIPAQKFLWRGQRRTGEPDIYAFTVSIFGASCSPYTSLEVKNRNALEFIDEYPEAVHAIREKHYMDDYVDCSHRPEEAIKIIREVIDIHGKGGFPIRNFSCSSREVLQQIPESLRSDESKDLTFSSELKSERILGLIWNPNSDELSFNLKMPKIDPTTLDSSNRPTKRQVLKVVMSVFDPMGFLGNYTVQGKMLLQDIWRSGLGWDDNLSDILTVKWTKWMRQLSSISDLKLKRCFAPDMTNITNLSLHVFCDGGEKAYATVAFLRIETLDYTTATIVMSKTRVSPLKPLSIPRLELQAALMGTRLADFIRQQLELEIQDTYYWTDSSTVLQWIRSDARNYKTIVSHRLGEIMETTDQSQWRWVPTKDNVADEGTRENSSVRFSSESRWVKGPNFLCLPENSWPKETNGQHKVNENDLELKSESVFLSRCTETQNLIDFSLYSSWMKLLRVTAWFFRFSSLWLAKIRPREIEFCAELTVPEIQAAEIYWIKQIQMDSFGQELIALESGSDIPRDSRLKCLSPILDSDGVLRLRGRIDASQLTDVDTNRPIILDNKHPVTKLLIAYHHVKAGHHGLERVFNDLRQRYWILDIRSAVKKAFGECQLCKNRRAKPIVPEMGSLPPSRLIGKIPPFTNCGIDYFGPMFVTIGRRREKRYGVLFTCLATRAIHIEIANSLTTDSAIMAIRRMVARRGAPVKMYSDNGTNLKGADIELRAALEELDQDKLTSEMTTRGIDWRFIPPAAPHMGGSWERLVQSVKIALKMTLNEQAPREETLLTFMTEAENTVNSRPLTHVSIDPDDPQSLTPNHFLRGSSGIAASPIGEFDDHDLTLRKQWRISQRLADLFWKRWIREYLPSLTRREKWHRKADPIKVGDVVLLVDLDFPRNTWKRGIITSVHPGKDGQIRVVDVKTATSSYRRPVAKVCVLDVLRDVDLQDPTSEGRNVGDEEK